MTPRQKDVFRVLRMVHRGQGILHEDNEIVCHLVEEEMIRSTQSYPSDPATGKETCKDSELTQRGRACLKMYRATKTSARLMAGAVLLFIVLVTVMLSWGIPMLLDWLLD